MMTVVLVDAQTFFTNGRYGKRSDLRFRGETEPLLFEFALGYITSLNVIYGKIIIWYYLTSSYS